MLMHSVETKVGTTIWFAASTMASCRLLSWSPSSRWALMFSIITVASSTRIPTASARPPSVMTLIVWPSTDNPMMELRIDSGMEVETISVERQLPTNTSTANPASTAALNISCSTLRMEAMTNPDWSLSGVMVTPGGKVCSIPGSSALMPLITARVEALPVFRICSMMDCCPLTRTAFCCGGPPAWTYATSRT